MREIFYRSLESLKLNRAERETFSKRILKNWHGAKTRVYLMTSFQIEIDHFELIESTDFLLYHRATSENTYFKRFCSSCLIAEVSMRHHAERDF